MEYIIDLKADVIERKMEFRNEDPVVVLRQALQACNSCAIQSLDLNFLDFTAGIMSVCTEHLSVIPVYYVRLYDVWNGDGGTMDDLLAMMRGLTVADLRPDPAEQATDATLRVCRERGVSNVYVCAADLISESSAISEEGIFDFCFGAEVEDSSGSVRMLDVDRPHLTPQFMGRLISTGPLCLSAGLCYRFDGDIPFQLHWNSAGGKLELRRGVAVDDHSTPPQEDDSDSDDD